VGAAGCGWVVGEAIPPRDAACRLLASTTLRIDRINEAACAVAAERIGEAALT
jgi:hypothetical protein